MEPGPEIPDNKMVVERGLSPEERRAFVEGAHDVRSASQMQQYVRSLTGRIQ